MNNEELRRQNEEERRKRLELIALLALLYTNMEDEMLRVIADGLGTDDFDGDLGSWRIRHLAAAESVGRKVSRIAGSYSAAEKQVFYTAINNASSAEINRVDTAVGQAAGSSAKTASRVSEYFRKQANHDINTVNTVMRYKAKQGYVTAVNSAFFTAKESERIWKALGDNALAVAEGRLSLQSAVRNAIVKMSEKGIPAFIDKAGREWTPEAYVRMDIRTTAANTARQAQWERCKEHNINLIEVSAHAGARPLCAPYQGGIYSLDGSSGTVKDAAGREINFTPLSSTSYGQAAGLFGINCGHQSYPFKPGINFRRYYPLETEEEFAENSKRYAEFQKQRAMERSIRASKRECMMCDAAGDKDGFTKASQKLARRKEAYREYSKSVGLKQHNDRTQVYGFDKSVSAKASWANRKAGLSANDVDYMSNSFRPKFSAANPIQLKGGNNSIEISVKQVSNSKYTLYTDTDVTAKNKAVRLVEKIMPSVEKQLPENFELPPIAVIDFEKNHLNSSAIGGYDKNLNILFFNSNYNSKDKITEFINKKSGYFANKTEYAPFLHELGHKYYEDSIKSLAISENLSYNKAKDIIDAKISDYIHDKELSSELDTALSGYALKGYAEHNYTEIIAESFSAKDINEIANELINLMKG